MSTDDYGVSFTDSSIEVRVCRIIPYRARGIGVMHIEKEKDVVRREKRGFVAR